MIVNNSTAIAPLLVALGITGVLYYLFEILHPYVKEVERYELLCKANNGFVLDVRNVEKRCINNNITIEVK